MDIATILGILSGFGLVIYGIGFGKLGNFLDIQSIAITIGGTLAVIAASAPGEVLKGIPKHLKIVIGGKKYDPKTYIELIVDLAQSARKNGLLSLEARAEELEDAFLKDSVLLIVDAIDSDKVKQLLEEELNYLDERHAQCFGFYELAAGTCPAFGMIGTLIGLVNMLKGLDIEGGGAGDIGPAMSVALITTFYGSLFANVIFFPIANKLKVRHAEEMLCKQMIVEGILSIQSGENPKFIREKLISYLSEADKADLAAATE
ncbi:motility protein A [Aminipila sp.]|jgi:chemotaxis protein MotA|uniref:motility protein A n=1 Tax=Aminipila sp. TaxID=2060095 RepID=UPI001E13D2E7|nr:motility protein A [Aminipila sp.]MBE6033280.1 motility protein A [Clostridiales bacterium]